MPIPPTAGAPAAALAPSRSAPLVTTAPSIDHGSYATGRLATASEIAADRKLPALPPSGPFLLMHHYNSWELVEIGLERPTWLPILKTYSLEGGRNSNRTTGGGIDFDPGKLRFERNGWQFIPEAAPFGPYRYQIDGAKGTVNLQIWDRVRVYPDGSFDREWDHAAYNRWRLSLVERGVLPAPRTSVLDRLMKRAQRRIGRNSKAIHIPAVAEKIKATEEKLAKMEAALQPAAVDPTASLAAENERLRQQLAAFQAQQAAQATDPDDPSVLPPEYDDDNDDEDDA